MKTRIYAAPAIKGLMGYLIVCGCFSLYLRCFFEVVYYFYVINLLALYAINDHDDGSETGKVAHVA